MSVPERSGWGGLQRSDLSTHVDQARNAPIRVSLRWRPVELLEPEPFEVLARMEIAAVAASDDRFDTGLVFIPVPCSLHQKPGRGSATIAVVNEQAPKEYGVQALQAEIAGTRHGASQDVGQN